MLIRYNTSNFLSFNEETEFNMLASNYTKIHRDHVSSLKKDINILRTSAIYGANGAGKSNLIKSINSLKEIVEKGAVPRNVDRLKNKLIEGNLDKPMTHEIEFSINNKIYTYGISFESNLCLEEWLYETGLKNPILIFERTYDKNKKHPKLKFNDKYIKTQKFKLLVSLLEENLLQNRELVLSKNETLKIREINEVVKWFNENLTLLYPETKSSSIFNNKYSDEKFKKFSENLLSGFDIGIDGLFLKSEDIDTFLKNENLNSQEAIDKIKNSILEKMEDDDIGVLSGNNFTISITKEADKYIVRRVVTNRIVNGHKIEFEIKEESDGTQRLFDFIPMIDDIIKNDYTYIIDEIDRSIHPSLLHKLVDKIVNSNIKGQLIFTTHESSLLDCKVFRPDEIWFAEKDRETQSTKLYTLAEFKPRYDLDIEKGYLNGRFGAIPFLSRLEDLNW